MQHEMPARRTSSCLSQSSASGMYGMQPVRGLEVAGWQERRVGYRLFRPDRIVGNPGSVPYATLGPYHMLPMQQSVLDGCFWEQWRRGPILAQALAGYSNAEGVICRLQRTARMFSEDGPFHGLVPEGRLRCVPLRYDRLCVYAVRPGHSLEEQKQLEADIRYLDIACLVRSADSAVDLMP